MLLIATLFTTPAHAEIDLPKTVQDVSEGRVTAGQVRSGMDAVHTSGLGRIQLASMMDWIDGRNEGRARNPVQKWLRELRERAGALTVDTVVSAVDGRPGLS